jgi:cytochrome bd-type quinol oxidase subunit 1
VVIANPCRIDVAWPNFCHLLLSTGTESAFFAGGVSTRKTSKKSTKKMVLSRARAAAAIGAG